jgi:hypothetical protein
MEQESKRVAIEYTVKGFLPVLRFEATSRRIQDYANPVHSRSSELEEEAPPSICESPPKDFV